MSNVLSFLPLRSRICSKVFSCNASNSNVTNLFAGLGYNANSLAFTKGMVAKAQVRIEQYNLK